MFARNMLRAGGAAGLAACAASQRRQEVRCDAATWAQVRPDVVKLLDADYTDSSYDGAHCGPIFMRLAWHSAGTFCAKSKTGGSDGATMCHAPESNWDANAGLGRARELLAPLAKQHSVSVSDLWVYAAGVAIEEMGGPKIGFSEGRTDKKADKCPIWAGPTHKDGRLPGADAGPPKDTAAHLRYIFNRMGFDDREIVALSGAHGLGACHTENSGYWGPWTRAPTTFSNEYYRELLENTWTIKTTHKGKPWTGPQQYEDPTGDLMMLPSDIVLIQDKDFRTHVEAYAKDDALFAKDFAAAWQKLMELGCRGVKNIEGKKGWW